MVDRVEVVSVHIEGKDGEELCIVQLGDPGPSMRMTKREVGALVALLTNAYSQMSSPSDGGEQ